MGQGTGSCKGIKNKKFAGVKEKGERETRMRQVEKENKMSDPNLGFPVSNYCGHEV